MKGSVAAVAALAGGVSAGAHRHAHDLFRKRDYEAQMESPACSVVYHTITGSMELYYPHTSTSSSSSYSSTSEAPCTVPTPIEHVAPTPGTYTYPATTVVVESSTTVYAVETTKVTKGTYTVGGYTTTVTAPTTLTCPYVSTETYSSTEVTSIYTTTSVCESAGTYTVAPITTTVDCENATTISYPVVTSYAPGTYTAAAVVTTVTESSKVVTCPFEIPTTSTKEQTKTYAPSSTAKAYPTKSAAADFGAVDYSATGGSGGGDLWAMTYTAYTDSGSCKSASQVMADITDIHARGFKMVRTYSTDCDTLKNVGAAVEKNGMTMSIGVFIGQPGCDNNHPHVAEQFAAIKAWGKYELVSMAIVGNEAQHNGYCTPGQLKALILQMKGIFKAAGCAKPVTTADTVASWLLPGFAATICPVVDIATANVHPYFDANTAPSQAGEFVKSQIAMVSKACGGKTAKVVETGYPNKCIPNGKAVCNTQTQAQAIESIREAMGGDVVFFSYTNDPWKGQSACGCEQFWGCGNHFPKSY